MPFRKFYQTLILILILSTISVYSQIYLEFKESGNSQTIVNTDTYPKFWVMVRASQNSGYFSLTKDEIVITEDNHSTLPESISPADAEGWQQVEWFTSLRSQTDTSNGRPPENMIFAVVHSGTSVASAISYILPSVSIVSVLDYKDDYLYDFNLGYLVPPNTDSKSIKIFPQAARKVNGREIPIAVDSITIGTKNFTYFDLYGPPFMMTSPFTHPADIIYSPLTSNYISDKMTIYYDKGRKTVMNMIGNNFNIPKNTLLKLLRPNGGEILTPCQTFLIKWSGSVKDIPTVIEYTVDKGYTWKQIAIVSDSSYLWTVPSDISSTVYMRVKQELQRSFIKILKVDDIPVNKVAYRSDGNKIIAQNYGGKIFEWDINSYNLTGTYNIGDEVLYPGEITFSKGLAYFNNNTEFVSAYNRYFMYPGDNPDTLAFFTVGNQTPVSKIGINDMSVKSICIDSRRELIAAMPTYSHKLNIYSTATKAFLKTVEFKYMITAFNFNPKLDEAVVALSNGDVLLLSLPNFSIKKSFNFIDYPNIIQIALSPNGNMIGFGCKQAINQEFVGNRNEMNIVDIASGLVVRTLRRTASNAVSLEFSPTSSILVSGNQGQPQIAFWDLPDDVFAGSIQGNEAVLTDMKVSPEGHSVAATSLSVDNLTVRYFTYPEQDLNDRAFSIEMPKLKVDTIDVKSWYIGSDNDITISNSFCNNGKVPVIIDFAKFFFGKHFRLKSKIETDTILPGSCLDFDITYHPLDTGKISDTLQFYSCAGIYKMPVNAYGMPRDLSFYQDPFDFGELCIGDTTYKDFMFLKNNDPVPVKINFVAVEQQLGNPFAIINGARDTIIKAGESIQLKMRFTPASVGLKSAKLFVNHSDLSTYVFEARVQGLGIGTIVEASHRNLRFIPEITRRKVTLTNASDNPISVFRTLIYSKNRFKVISQLPIAVQPKGIAEIEIEWDGTAGTDDTLIIEAQPCVQKTFVILGDYKGVSSISIPTVETSAKNIDAVIPVNFKNTANYAYSGERFFEGELTINPRIFLPISITTSFGQAKIIKNEILNDRRYIGIRIDGDFASDTGVVAYIHGVAGLAEVDTSHIEFSQASKFWGTAVKTSVTNGIFRINDLCGDRRILQPSVNLANMMVSPNPSDGQFSITFDSDLEGTASVEVLDNIGTKVMQVTSFKVVKGSNTLNMLNIGLAPGVYNVVVTMGGAYISKQIVVVR